MRVWQMPDTGTVGNDCGADSHTNGGVTQRTPANETPTHAEPKNTRDYGSTIRWTKFSITVYLRSYLNVFGRFTVA